MTKTQNTTRICFANMTDNKTNTNCSEGKRRYCVLNRLHTQRNNFIVNNKISMLVGDGDDVGRRFPQLPESNPMRTKGQHIPKRRSLTPTVFVFHTNRHTTYTIHPGANIATAYERGPHEDRREVLHVDLHNNSKATTPGKHLFNKDIMITWNCNLITYKGNSMSNYTRSHFLFNNNIMIT